MKHIDEDSNVQEDSFKNTMFRYQGRMLINLRNVTACCFEMLPITSVYVIMKVVGVHV